ncbi:MAG: hypothetical protein MI864_07330 [Pseudomonadales bacterium]|uniref:Uncharacterized protein n=1 Tax=Oleiphilus messinensis TaxID=141451 RepID=A0A1Y0I255_9GAMM|nr:hypothetical protein [Oleiphilus messinensis]ARU54578.1 hypothetical protein OLMES_0474 [Oleiphilus messinensis]MCG8610331.1 hypothetical protein [Pseudomonadales bacterium]
MPSTFNKIHRLKRLWTWEQFIEQYEVGPDIKTLKANYRFPHLKPSKNTVAVIDRLHEQSFPSPFPREIDGLMDIYDCLFGQDQDPASSDRIQKLEQFIQFELEVCQSEHFLREVRLNWLLGDIYFDRIMTLRNAGFWSRLQDAQSQAITLYQRAIRLLEEKSDLNEVVIYKLRQNILGAYLNGARRQGHWIEDEPTRNYLQQSDFMAKTKEVLALEPFNWNIARNGLRFASLLEDELNVMYFFKCLVNVSELFVDMDYKPLDTPALAKSPDFHWAIQKVLKPTFLKQFNLTRTL